MNKNKDKKISENHVGYSSVRTKIIEIKQKQKQKQKWKLFRYGTVNMEYLNGLSKERMEQVRTVQMQ